MLRSLLALLFSALLLSGCATLRSVQSDVQSYSTLGSVPPQAAFRFDRAPSQQQNGARQLELETMAAQALTRVGLRHDDAQARYSVQVGVRLQREDRADWPDAWWHGGLPGQHFGHWHPWSSPWLHTTPWYQRELSLLLRDLATGQIVYETHAAQEGPWSDNAAILPAMFGAALSDFPAAPPGVRKITTEVPAP